MGFSQELINLEVSVPVWNMRSLCHTVKQQKTYIMQKFTASNKICGMHIYFSRLLMARSSRFCNAHVQLVQERTMQYCSTIHMHTCRLVNLFDSCGSELHAQNSYGVLDYDKILGLFKCTLQWPSCLNCWQHTIGSWR